MDFTQEQLEFISKLVDAKVRKATEFKKRKTRTLKKEFHSYHEIREIILKNKDVLTLELDYAPFRFQTIVHCIRKIMVLRPADSDLLANGVIRLDAQCREALTDWSDNPFEQIVDHPRHYCWKTHE